MNCLGANVGGSAIIIGLLVLILLILLFPGLLRGALVAVGLLLLLLFLIGIAVGPSKPDPGAKDTHGDAAVQSLFEEKQ